VQEFLRDLDVEQRRVGGNFALVLVFVAVRGDQERAVDRAVDGVFAFRAAADGADFFSFSGTETIGFAFFADWAGHGK